MIWAKFDKDGKPTKNLEEHTIDCLNIFKELIIFKQPIIDKICNKYLINKDEFLTDCFLTVFFHDFGKGNNDFQNRKKSGFPHALASLPFVDINTNKTSFVSLTGKKEINISTLSIASHHTSLHRDLYLEQDKNTKFEEIDEIKKLMEKANEFYFKIFRRKLKELKFPNLNEKPYEILKKTFPENIKEKKLRDLFILQKGMLNYCDWIASGKKIEHFLVYNNKIIENKLKEDKKFEKWFDFQKEAMKTKGNLLLRAPTGCGKTEASLLWISNNLNNNKIIYLLPTRITANKMWKRAKKFFNENVGLSHAYASYILEKNKDEVEEEYKEDEIKNEVLLGKTFIKPITITTVDHLLLSMLNHGRWDISSNNIYNSLIVFDEIHCYDFYTLGLIYKAIEILKDYNVNFCFMSATFPNFLEEDIKNILGEENYKIVSVSENLDKDLFERKTVDIYRNKEGENIESSIEKIKERYEKKQKILIICNTIEKSKRMFNILKENGIKNIMLYNSEFILKDRIEKEEILETIDKIKEGFVAITTQVVEVSLDLDFDVLFTEIAPIDSIVQRIGRVNRKPEKTKKEICDVFVYFYDEEEIKKSGKWVYPYTEKNILDISWDLLKGKNLKYKDYKRLVDILYSENNIKKDEIEDGKNKIDDILKKKGIYRLELSEEEMENGLTRRSDVVYVDVIPSVFEGKIEKNPTKYLLKIAYWKVKNKIRKDSFDKGWLIADISYNSEIGVDYGRNTKENII